MKTTLATVIATLALLPVLYSGSAACGAADDEADCQSNSTYLAQGARRVLDVNLGFTPGPILAVSTDPVGNAVDGADDDGDAEEQTVSRPRRLWLDPGRERLLALDQDALFAVDLGSFEPVTETEIGSEAGTLAVSPDSQALVVTDRIQGEVKLIPLDGISPPVSIPVGAGPNGVALGPGQRLAYVANEISGSLTIIETGLGAPRQDDRRVYVSATGEGVLVALDADGRIRRRYGGLPIRLRDLFFVPGGHRLLASYSELLVTGEIGTLGDGDLSVDEGVVELDLESGAVTRWSLGDEAPAADRLGRPCGLISLSGGKQVAVAVPGWSKIFVLDVSDTSATRGQVVRRLDFDGEPSWLAAGDPAGDWLYVLDEGAHSVTALDTKGGIAGVASLR